MKIFPKNSKRCLGMKNFLGKIQIQVDSAAGDGTVQK